MSVYTKKYANKEKGKRWRKLAGIKIGHNKFTPRPSSHALKRKAVKP